VKLTTHLQVVARLRIRGVLPQRLHDLTLKHGTSSFKNDIVLNLPCKMPSKISLSFTLSQIGLFMEQLKHSITSQSVLI
jgi:hypothetical protein